MIGSKPRCMPRPNEPRVLFYSRCFPFQHLHKCPRIPHRKQRKTQHVLSSRPEELLEGIPNKREMTTLCEKSTLPISGLWDANKEDALRQRLVDWVRRVIYGSSVPRGGEEYRFTYPRLGLSAADLGLWVERERQPVFVVSEAGFFSLLEVRYRLDSAASRE